MTNSDLSTSVSPVLNDMKRSDGSVRCVKLKYTQCYFTHIAIFCIVVWSIDIFTVNFFQTEIYLKHTRPSGVESKI
jgi:hypothetical protein